MHVAVEASKLLRDRRGIGRYVRMLLRTIVQVQPDIRFTLYVRDQGDARALREELVRLEVADHCEFALARAMSGTDADVAWYPWSWIPHTARNAAMVVTIHDLVPMLKLDHRRWRLYKRWKYRRRFRKTVASAHGILAVSEFTASEITRLLHVERDQVRVVPPGVDEFLVASGIAGAAVDHLVPAGPFFLSVGAHDRRKNLEVLFDGMARLQARGERAELVLCGPGDGLARYPQAGRAPWLRWVGYVSDAELAALYRRATALVFPSRYEGFGLPALEAMAAGGCVVCADASSLPEVTGNAALRFPPDDAGALAEQLSRLLHDPEMRAILIARGKLQAARFEWRQTARQTVEGFEAAIVARWSGRDRRR